MTCPRRNHHLLLIYCLFVLLHVQQTVNSLQNGYHRHPANTHSRYGHNPQHYKYAKKGSEGSTDDMDPRVDNLGHKELVLNGIREKEREHHFRHQHHRQLHRHEPQHSSTVNSLRNDELHRLHSIKFSHENVHHRFATRRIEEAVHAFQTSTTERPVALHGPFPHQHHHHSHYQPLQSSHTTADSLRPTPSAGPRVSHSRSNNQQTLRPGSHNSLESQKKSLAWAVNHHHQGSSVNEFSTASPLDIGTEPSSRIVPSKGSSGDGSSNDRIPLHQTHSKHSDETDDTYDDEDYYYYEEDNDNDGDDTENDDEDEENANEDSNGHRVLSRVHSQETLNRLEAAKPMKIVQQRVIINSEHVPYMLRGNVMEYDEHNFLADEPVDGLGSLTEQKWRNYSTREGVEKMARAENPNIAAAAHLKRINQEGLCKYPHPKVVPVSNNTSKRFIPHCTILHRCGDDTGCCWSDTKTCVAKSTASVVLYFYVIPMGQTRSVIEPLSLINHTECHCVDRNQVRTTTTSSLFSMTPSPERQNGRCVKYFDLDESDPDYVRCDCLDRNTERREACQRLSRGEEGFMLEDQRCISQGRCKPPTCEYGQYNRTMGRCPSKDHKIETAKNVNQPFH